MNTNSKRGFRGFGFYAILVLIVILIWYGLTGNTSTSTYTRAEFEKALQKGNVTYVKVEQNREVPTGSLKIKLKDGTQQYLYASDINEMQTLMDQNKFENYVVPLFSGSSFGRLVGSFASSFSLRVISSYA